jgi:hypothetical protein
VQSALSHPTQHPRRSSGTDSIDCVPANYPVKTPAVGSIILLLFSVQTICLFWGRKHADGLCGEGPSIQSGDGCLAKQFTPSIWGLLTTASGLVFGGDADGSVTAYDARAGKVPLELPDRYVDFGGAGDATIGGKQLVLVASGSTLFAFGLPGAGN